MPFYRSALSRWITPLVVLALLLAGCSSPASQAEEATPTPVPTPVIPTKPTYKVARGEVVRMLEFTARLVPMVEQELYFKTGGRIQTVLVKKGDVVEEGQLLAGLETGTSNVDVRRAEINLEVAKLSRELFIMQANKFSQEYPIYLKMKDYDIEVAQLALDEINARVDTAQVKAPFKGTLLSVFITPDRSVEAFKGVMVLADLSKLEVSADLTSTDLQLLQEGMPVTVAAVSGPATTLTGSIRKLPYPYGKADPTVSEDATQDTATRVGLTDDPSTANLTLGDLVRVQVILEKRDAALWLPPQAIRKFEGRRFVVVQDSDTQRRVDVKIGITSDDRVEILEGLEEGQVVIAP
jgi:membrane fusion protein, macrolide-specific efflux system